MIERQLIVYRNHDGNRNGAMIRHIHDDVDDNFHDDDIGTTFVTLWTQARAIE